MVDMSFTELSAAHRAKLSAAAAKRDNAHEAARQAMGQATREHGEAVRQHQTDHEAELMRRNDLAVRGFYKAAEPAAEAFKKEPTRAGAMALDAAFKDADQTCRHLLGEPLDVRHVAVVLASEPAKVMTDAAVVGALEGYLRAHDAAGVHAALLDVEAACARSQHNANHGELEILKLAATRSMAGKLRDADQAERMARIKNKHHLVPERPERTPVAAKPPVQVDLGGLESLPNT